jgi:pimeloyl-ACP methyl ester carboxylesterase
MNNSWTVLGGWGVPPEELRPIFGDNSIYIDVNMLAEVICTAGHLATDWKERIAAAVLPHLENSPLLAGWSTGAILALGCAPLLNLDGLVLISCTPSFCRNATFRFGVHPRILRGMRDKLATNPATVLRDFRRQCGFPVNRSFNAPWTPDALQAGLHLLEQIVLDPAAFPLSCEPLFMHGTRDTIIPFDAGSYLHHSSGGVFVPFDAPHACFIGNETEITSQLETYLQRNKQ